MSSHHDPPNLWTETKDPVSGESSLKTHTLKVVWKGCKPTEHYFIESENPREIVCKHCNSPKPFIIGYHKLIDGTLAPVK